MRFHVNLTLGTVKGFFSEFVKKTYLADISCPEKTLRKDGKPYG